MPERLSDRQVLLALLLTLMLVFGLFRPEPITPTPHHHCSGVSSRPPIPEHCGSEHASGIRLRSMASCGESARRTDLT